MTQPKDDKWVAVLCLVGAMLGYGCVPVFLRFFIQTEKMDFWSVNAARYSVAAIFWSPAVFLLLKRQRESGVPAGRSVWRDALVPTAVNLFGQATYGAAPAFVSAPTIGFVIRLSFLFAVLFGFLFIAEERLLAARPAFLVGAALSLAGVVAMFLGQLRAEGTGSVAGLAILLASTIGWGAYAVSVRKWMAPYPVRLGFGVISLYTSGGLILLALAFGRPGTLAPLSGGMWLVLILSGLIGVTFAHVMYYRGIHRLGPVVASGMLMATPFVTYTGAALALGETMAPAQLAGGITVVAGGVLLVVAKGQVERKLHQPGELDKPRPGSTLA